MKLRYIAFETHWNNTHYDHKPVGQSGKVIVGLQNNIGFFHLEELK